MLLWPPESIRGREEATHVMLLAQSYKDAANKVTKHTLVLHLILNLKIIEFFNSFYFVAFVRGTFL